MNRRILIPIFFCLFAAKLSAEPPPLAKAPFTAEQAAEFQKQWAGAAADLSMVPQYGDNETEAEHDARMEWFRDAKFGLFIHWGPSSIGGVELSWGRKAPRPYDVRITVHRPRAIDPEYDNYYKEFNPTNFDADALVRTAKEAGMRYIVITAKHHDGFAMFDSKVSDYDIMATPYGKDIVGEVVEACRKYDMRIGFYYSTRDWWHEDYLVGDNKKYDEYYREQIRELLTNYGNIDIMWFDHVGGQDWSKWDFEALFSMMYRLQPDLIVNDRATKFIGWDEPRNQNQPDAKIVKMTKGDYYTPEGRVGEINLKQDWEACIHAGPTWGYTPANEKYVKTPKTCIQYLVSCATGGGNLLLNFGPRPDGSITDGELLVAREMGKWLEHHGEAIYGTNGGPYHNGGWGGTTHRGNTMYVHIASFPEGGLALDPIDNKVLSARILTGGEVSVEQDENEMLINVPAEDRDEYVTVVELTMEKPIESGTIIGKAKMSEALESTKGELLTETVVLVATGGEAGEEVNATEGDLSTPGDNVFKQLLKTPRGPEPWAIVDLGSTLRVNLLEVGNVGGGMVTHNLDLYASLDGETWEKVWSTESPLRTWEIPLTRFHSGIYVPGRDVRYLKLVRDNGGNSRGRNLILDGIRAFGGEVDDWQ